MSNIIDVMFDRLEDLLLEADEEEKLTITDKEFYKAMQKLKERGTNAVPPKKSASAYIIFGKEVSSKAYYNLSSSLTLAIFNF